MSKSFVCLVLLTLVATCALGKAHSNTPTKSPSFPSPTTASTASPPASPPSTATPSPSPSSHESSLTSSPTSSPSIPPLAPTTIPSIVTPASSISQTPNLSAAPLLNVTIGLAVAVILAALHLLTKI
ncbi:proline-rich receptor-like protein kinase PERK1 [Gossypium raimondii]|uniref:proline-rich receptor-like protein kinase PERK1 n=1 Tax=Gossypium raimondii TaxID=29730 RepID=UPI00227C528E|nr:proline-rich receptor-like protein kinase PERK1 [Gossypium raimondii]